MCIRDRPVGAYRKISREEVRKLEAAAELSRQEVASDPRPRKSAGAKKRKTAGKRSTTAGKTYGKKAGGKKSATKRPAKTKRGRSKPEFDIKLKAFDDDADARVGAVIGGDGSAKPKKRTAKKKTPKTKAAKKKTGRNFGKKRGGGRK